MKQNPDRIRTSQDKSHSSVEYHKRSEKYNRAIDLRLSQTDIRKILVDGVRLLSRYEKYDLDEFFKRIDKIPPRELLLQILEALKSKQGTISKRNRDELQDALSELLSLLISWE